MGGQIGRQMVCSDKYEDFPFGMNFSLRASGSRLLEGTKTRPYDLKNYAGGFDYMKPNNGEEYGAGHDENYNRRSIFTYLYGGTPINVDHFNYSSFHWNSPVSPLDLSARSPEHSQNFLRRFYQKVGLNSLKTNDTFIEAMQEDLGFDNTGPYGETLFSVPDETDVSLDTSARFGDFMKNLGAITKMINVAKTKGYRRQIYLVQLHGFDTHGSQLNSHPALLRELSLGLNHFNSAMEELGLSNNVVAYTTSDFGRTVSNNGDEPTMVGDPINLLWVEVLTNLKYLENYPVSNLVENRIMAIRVELFLPLPIFRFRQNLHNGLGWKINFSENYFLIFLTFKRIHLSPLVF